MDVDRAAYFTRLKRLLTEYYSIIHDANQVSATQEEYMQGFLSAGRVLGVVTEKEQKQVIAEVHLRVFGETIEERAKAKNSRPARTEDYYDIPTWKRRGLNMRFSEVDASGSGAVTRMHPDCGHRSGVLKITA